MASIADSVIPADVPTIEVAEKQTAANDAKPKKAAVKAKKSSVTKKSKTSPTHPPFFQMISDAIVTLKERTGSSQYAITKFNEEKYKQLPANFRKLLLVQLKKFVAADKLVKVKNSYKLPSARSVQAKSASAAAPVPAKKPAEKLKKTVAKPKAKIAVKPKPKTLAKATKPKPKTVTKSKVVAKPKAAAPAKRKAAAVAVVNSKPTARAAKVAKTLTQSSPGKRVAPAAKTKKVVVKKPKTVKSPARKVQARKVKK